MKLREYTNPMPFLAGGAAAAGFFLRRGLYALAMNDRGLLEGGHPLALALWALTAAVLLLCAYSAWKGKGPEAFEDNFAPSALSLIGHFLAAAATGATVTGGLPPRAGLVGQLWQYAGLASALCLLAAGISRGTGKKPFFLLHLVPGCFYALHVVCSFQGWSGDPQTMDYVFDLLAAIALAFFCVYTAYLEIGLGRRRMQLFSGLAAVYLAAVSAAAGEYALVYAGSILFALGNLVTLTPKPPREEETAHDEAA